MYEKNEITHGMYSDVFYTHTYIYLVPIAVC